jgi:hypothetical protein
MYSKAKDSERQKSFAPLEKPGGSSDNQHMPIRSPVKKKAGQENPTTVLAKWKKYRAIQKKKAAKGGKARAAKLSKKKLSEQGRNAVQARWKRARAAK